MGRAPCCDKANVKKGPWSPEEDEKLKEYIEKHGTGGNWIAFPQKAGLKRCGKSCRLRWLNYLRPDIKHGEFSDDEDRVICSLYASIGSRWSIIAAQLPGRTDNDIKNYWNTKLKKKLLKDHRKTPTTNPSNISLLQTSSPSSPSVLSPSPSSSSAAAAAAYKSSDGTNYYITTQTSPWTGYEPITISSSLLQSQEGYMGNSLNPYQVKDSTALMFGGGEASCSTSSDGSYNQISHGRSEMDHDYQSYFCNGFGENQELMISCGGNPNGFAEEPIGFYGETTTDYYSSLEEIRKLICTDNVCNNLSSVGKNKTEEKVLYY